MADETVDGGAVVQVERIVKAATAAKVTIDGREYATSRLYDPRTPEPEPKTLQMNTLQGLADYLNDEADLGFVGNTEDPATQARKVFVHVLSPETVVARTEIYGAFNQRVDLASAKAVVPPITFGSWQDPESFIIMLVSLFVPSVERDKVQAFVSKLTISDKDEMKDNGVSQDVAITRGISGTLKENTQVPSRVLLAPYRTFSEVTQPESLFLLRLHSNGAGRVPSIGLFEADGGLWRLEAVRRVKEWLKGEVPDYSIFG